MSPGGDSRERRVPLISGSHRTVSASCSPCARPVPRRTLVHSRPHPGTTRDTTPRPAAASPNVRAGPVPSPLHPLTPGRSPNRSPPGAPRQTVRRSSTSCEPRGTLSKSSTNCMKPTTRIKLTRRSDGSPISTPPDRYPNTAKSSTPSSHGEKRSSPTTPPEERPTDPSKGSTTSYKSYDASLTGSPTPTITPPKESS